MFYGGLIGQFHTFRSLSWDDDLDVSVSANDGNLLSQYIRTLNKVGVDRNIEFYIDDHEFLWYIDNKEDHHIEHRLYSSCPGESDKKLITVSNDLDACPRFYVDITNLHNDSRLTWRK